MSRTAAERARSVADMTGAAAIDSPPRELRKERPRSKTTPKPSWRERVATRLGYRVVMPQHGRHEPFLESAPELVGAIRNGWAQFAHVAEAGYAARFKPGVSADEQERLKVLYPELLERFEGHAGAMRRWYFSDHQPLAAALTDDDQISVRIGPHLTTCHPEVIDLVRQCQQVGYTAWHRLAPYDRRLCQDMVFSVIEEAFRMIEDEGCPKARYAHCVKVLTRRLEAAEQFMLRCASRRAQSCYLKGVLLGLGAIGIVLAATAVVLAGEDALTRFHGQLLLIATAGAVGAAISVPMRMTSGSFRMNLPTLNAEMKGTDVRLVASLRPVMGLVLALGSYAVVLAGLVPMDEGDDPVRQTALYVAIGFLAGFTERFAQDMFVRSGNGLQGVMGDSPSSGPSAGISPPPGAQVGTASAL
jgi:hypothetical protein